MTKLVFSVLLLFAMSFGTVAPLLRLLEDKRYEWVETESEDAADEDSKTESEKAKEKELLAACWPVQG